MGTPDPSDRLPDELSQAFRSLRPQERCPSPAVMAEFLDGQLDGAARARFLLHLGRCRDCSDEVIELRDVLAHKSGILRAAEAAPHAQTPTRRRTRVLRLKTGPATPAWAYVAAATIMFAALAWLANSLTSDSEAGRSVAKTPKHSPVPVAPPKGMPPVAIVPPAPVEQPPKGPTPESQNPEPPAPDPATNPPDQRGPVAQVPEVPPDSPHGPGTAPAAESRFELASVQGHAEVLEGNKEWKPLREGEKRRVAGGVALRAKGGAPARLSFAGGTLSMERESEVSLGRDPHGYQLALRHGGIVLDAKGEREVVTLAAGSARFEGQSTRCLVQLEGRDARVVALDGDLSITSGEKTVSVAGGLECRVPEGKAPVLGKKADLKPTLAWMQELETYVRIEAEKGSFNQGLMHVVEDGGADGGAYVTSPRQSGGKGNDAVWAEYTVEVKHAGTYRVLARVAKGSYKTTNAHLPIQVDGRPAGRVAVIASDQQWRWSELDATVALEPGAHKLRFRDPWGGHRLDRILVTSDTFFSPE